MTHSEKINDAGEMYITTSEGVTCYDIRTNAWFYRGWKTYFADKICRILSGEATLIYEQNGFDVRERLTRESWEKVIPHWVPHIFYFPTDTRMLEWFPENTKSENFERYKKMK